ncbi:hypothetical protein ASPZODRAFT_1583828 [Penicilliopsis zonata CBS 506.65]|uniref:Uncharacterized protein n=1 Tax=Penicilliopsis zonata CBS 506.65 TaxID=1073090 RepID=A0A1L9SMF3_9EURO|nr:hypothetical protein ASPZODRAFT_1583828 [Penicilliopsis zonata CBS 506.65]OJJ48390.1 hypothetical protein ASPZODRAFT_1583828 [Penicilliopsis zonata CBS 506.65]
MVLLTSSTVSAILTSGIICISTILLFLTGYALQQQSVRNIQHALRPPSTTPIAHQEHSNLARNVHSGQEVLPELSLDRDKASYPGARGNYAYLQLLSDPDPSNICSAIAFFKTLATNSTIAQDRLFMYPQDWDLAPPSSISTPVSTALSLLRAASTKYGIWLLPIDMTKATSAGYTVTDTKVLRLGQIQFMQYDGVLYVQTPGLLLDTEKLDSMLFSHSLPLRHDKSRPDSYNNEAWIPMPLRPDRDATLPPVYLVTVNNVGSQIEARGHIPNVSLPGFGDLVTGPWGVHEKKGHKSSPGYVYFEKDKDGYVQWAGNPLFGAWRAKQYDVCDGLDLDDTYE